MSLLKFISGAAPKAIDYSCRVVDNTAKKLGSLHAENGLVCDRFVSVADRAPAKMVSNTRVVSLPNDNSLKMLGIDAIASRKQKVVGNNPLAKPSNTAYFIGDNFTVAAPMGKAAREALAKLKKILSHFKFGEKPSANQIINMAKTQGISLGGGLSIH